MKTSFLQCEAQLPCRVQVKSAIAGHANADPLRSCFGHSCHRLDISFSIPRARHDLQIEILIGQLADQLNRIPRRLRKPHDRRHALPVAAAPKVADAG